jgi:hypothetical protein
MTGPAAKLSFNFLLISPRKLVGQAILSPAKTLTAYLGSLTCNSPLDWRL